VAQKTYTNFKSLDSSFRKDFLAIKQRKGDVQMEVRVHVVRYEDYNHFTTEVILEKSHKISREIERLRGIKWDLEGAERTFIEKQMDDLNTEDMKLMAVLSAREEKPELDSRY
jgi:hypothetical protein